jgi:hypothetical protein
VYDASVYRKAHLYIASAMRAPGRSSGRCSVQQRGPPGVRRARRSCRRPNGPARTRVRPDTPKARGRAKLRATTTCIRAMTGGRYSPADVARRGYLFCSFAIAHIHAPPQDVVIVCEPQIASESHLGPALDRSMQDPANELPRTSLLSTSVNRGRGYECGVLPRPLPGRGSYMVARPQGPRICQVAISSGLLGKLQRNISWKKTSRENDRGLERYASPQNSKLDARFGG